MMILINGAIGSGKSTLARWLQNGLGEPKYPIIEYRGGEIPSLKNLIVVDNILELNPKFFDYVYSCSCPKRQAPVRGFVPPGVPSD